MDEAQAAVDDLILALDMLDRPLTTAGSTYNIDQQAEQFDDSDLPEGSVTRPEVVELSVAGVGITRRKAE